MKRFLISSALAAALLLVPSAFNSLNSTLQAFPRPNPVPVSWELSLDHYMPKRIVVTPPGYKSPQAYWYMAYKVQNNTKEDQQFRPTFTMLDSNGNEVKSDIEVPPLVFDLVKAREKNQFLVTPEKIMGRLIPGEDQAKESVGIWAEPEKFGGKFSIFVKGLSGESGMFQYTDGVLMPVTDVEVGKMPIEEKAKLIHMYKTLRLDFQVIGDVSAARVEELGQEYVFK